MNERFVAVSTVTCWCCSLQKNEIKKIHAALKFEDSDNHMLYILQVNCT